MRYVTCLLVVLVVPVFMLASGHGPLFGLATPTNSQGEWSFDEGISVERPATVLKRPPAHCWATASPRT